MPVYRLGPEPVFPDPNEAEEGLLAVGGDLSPERLLVAYASGIFPWYSEGQPILWHSPDPRAVLVPQELHVPRSLEKVMRRGRFEVRFDTGFATVIRSCARVPRREEAGTWITPEMSSAYIRLHELGFAHSVEAWEAGELVGGLYGVSLGSAFFGESMFALRPDASKVALVALVRRLVEWDFDLLDCQMETAHLARFGAVLWPRPRFLAAVARCLERETRRGDWSSPGSIPPHG